MSKGTRIEKARKSLLIISRILAAVMSIVLGVLIVGREIAFANEDTVSQFLGQDFVNLVKNETDDDESVDANYYTSEYESVKDVKSAGMALTERVMEEGAVLLRNNGALPLDVKTDKVSLFSVSSVDPVYSGARESSMKKASSAEVDLYSGLKNAGLTVNDELYENYKALNGTYGRKLVGTNSGIYEIYNVNEAPWSAIGAAKTREGYKTAVFVLSRIAGEGTDCTVRNLGEKKTDETNGNYLILTPDERDVLSNIAAEKAKGTFDKFIVIMNATNQVACDFEDEYGVDALLYCGGLGSRGANAVGKILTGAVNPSGKLSDTFWKNHYLNPTLTNWGQMSYNESASMIYQYVGFTYGNSNKYADGYVVYQEGIYSGYRYTETRYEDVALGVSNAGDYVYGDVVAYPFGYGLSYTEFEYSDMNVTYDKASDAYDVSVKVTNKGMRKGKNAVQLFLQKPYTDFDRSNGIEKAAVELADFEKTAELASGASETVKLKVDRRELSSYDSYVNGTYILEQGDYYFTVASDAHAAVNNILAVKGAKGADAVGNTALVKKINDVKSDELLAYSEAAETGKKITNVFDNADLKLYDGAGNNANAFDYITRNDWQGTVKYAYGSDGRTFLNNYVKLDKTPQIEKDGSAKPESDSERYPTYGAAKKWQLIDMMYDEDGERLAYDDPRWEELLDQLTFKETADLLSNGFSMTKNVDSIGKPATYDYDSDLGVINRYSAGSAGLANVTNDPDKNQYPPMYLDNGIVGATRNKELCVEYGEQWGEDCLWAGYQGLYGTGANIHRNPYLGRTYGYYSEDPLVTGVCAGMINTGMESRGSYMLLKHCMLNEQECNRCGGASWANEQTIREVYLKAFQIAIERGGVQGVMTALNRIGAIPAPHHPFINEVLRGEFGMSGYCVTDSYMGYMEIGSCVLAGNDLPLSQDSRVYNYETGYGKVAWAMRESAHNILYSVVNSSAMNGITSDIRIISFEPEWKHALNVAMPTVAVIATLLILLFIAAEIWRYFWKPIPAEYFAEEIVDEDEADGAEYGSNVKSNADSVACETIGSDNGSKKRAGGNEQLPKPRKRRVTMSRIKSNIITTGILGGVALVLTVVMIVANVLTFYTFDGLLTTYFGYTGGTQLEYDSNQYYERRANSLEQATQLARQVGIELEGEGAVLMKNKNNALPLTSGNKVSLFSVSSVDIVRSVGGGSGATSGGGSESLMTALDMFGIEANPTLWNFYLTKSSYRRKIGGLAQATNPDNAYPWAINEVPYAEYTDQVINSYSAYGDAAIVVIGRTGCENGDLPRSMSVSTKGKNTETILELDEDERKLLENVRKKFDKVIVLLNTANVMNCGFLDEYNVDACLWIGGVGQYGMLAVGGILAGKLSPSGRLVDTHVYDVFSAPASQNFGNFEYHYNGSHGTGKNAHHYVTYSEGIYVGYKYYETRYEDKILGRGNAGDYDYSKTVAYPFGYGLSYTSFDWSDFKVARKGDEITVSVKVTNTGNRPGKDVVEVYIQSPYTEYDITNTVEKAAVQLVNFGKTDKLKSGESQVMSVTFDVEEMKSYDAFGKGAYYLEGSDEYYVTAARDAHKAINNILALKGKTKADGMDEDGDTAFAKKLKIDEKVYDTDRGGKISNRFDDADGSEYYDDIKYLSRNDWSVMDNNGLTYGKKLSTTDAEGDIYYCDMSAELKAKLELTGYAASGAPDEQFSKVTTGAKNGLKLIEYMGKDFDDPSWSKLLDQVTVEEMVNIAWESAYKTMQVSSVAKPVAGDMDGPQGFKSFIGDNVNVAGMPVEVVTASTWNQELAYRAGDITGELCLWLKVGNTSNLTGWYAPAMNIHRTPFGGRNVEYYSECGVLSAKIGANVVKGATDRGVLCYIKHFALNDQERNRMTDNVTWAREQAIREIYLRPFEESIKYGGSKGIMTSYNRIGTTWAGGNYNLLTGVVRNEWGFNGFILTDYMDGNYENVDQMLAAGGDGALNPQKKGGPCTTSGDRALTYLRRAMHHCLYAVGNSNAMNGIDSNSTINVGTPKYKLMMAGIDSALAVLIIACIAFILLKWFVFGKPKRKKIPEVSAITDVSDQTDVPGSSSVGSDGITEEVKATADTEKNAETAKTPKTPRTNSDGTKKTGGRTRSASDKTKK